ncbi:hypothetical protein [Pseudotabrizicola formosa]|uniref:hypothetical protein n=1 Tax=Pseudotabrizicola formosa TaxID=2030009 RepID=UPI000CD311CA|nr:hypothetical protein [Pseudotabrizicola formosa]
MIGFLRLLVFWSAFAAIAYWSLLIYSRSVRREALEKQWDADPPEGATDAMRRAFIEEGMSAYEGSLRRKLLWGVVVLPFLAIGTLLYLVNYA